MFGWFNKRKKSPQSEDDLTVALRRGVEETLEDLDLDLEDADTRVGVSLYFVLSKQFSLIGKPEGEFPYVEPFSSDKARGALLGTAIAVVFHEHGSTPHKSVIDAAVTAFTLAFGREIGRAKALQTIEESAAGNVDIDFASDWAIQDARTSLDPDSVTSPAAYYLAVGNMI